MAKRLPGHLRSHRAIRYGRCKRPHHHHVLRHGSNQVSHRLREPLNDNRAHRPGILPDLETKIEERADSAAGGDQLRPRINCIQTHCSGGLCPPKLCRTGPDCFSTIQLIRSSSRSINSGIVMISVRWVMPFFCFCSSSVGVAKSFQPSFETNPFQTTRSPLFIRRPFS